MTGDPWPKEKLEQFLVLYFVKKLPVQKIGDMMNMTAHTVAVRASWCRRRKARLPKKIIVDGVEHTIEYSVRYITSEDRRRSRLSAHAPPNSSAKVRKCLRCLRDFKSAHIGERVCPDCKHSESWRHA